MIQEKRGMTSIPRGSTLFSTCKEERLSAAVQIDRKFKPWITK